MKELMNVITGYAQCGTFGEMGLIGPLKNETIDYLWGNL
jgi:hypothetical protein